MGYVIKTVDGELQEYAFDIGGVLALRNFKAVTNGNRLIIESNDNANFTILDALVNEVEIDGVVYDDPTAAQEALQRLVFNPLVPVVLPESERDLIPKGLKPNTPIQITAGNPYTYEIPVNADLYALRISDSTNIKLGKTLGADDLGEFSPSQASTWTLGFISVDRVFIESDTNITITPITFQW